MSNHLPKEAGTMPPVRIGPKHQVTIPQEVFKHLQLKIGDFLEASAQHGQVVLTPLQVSAKAPTPRLTSSEQRLVARAKPKIARIQRDLQHARGLTSAEANAAAKARLIDPNQAYWWTEGWQRHERQAERDLKQGNLLGPFESVEEFKTARAKRRKPYV